MQGLSIHLWILSLAFVYMKVHGTEQETQSSGAEETKAGRHLGAAYLHITHLSENIYHERSGFRVQYRCKGISGFHLHSFPFQACI